MNRVTCFIHNNIKRNIYYDDNYFKVTTDNLALANFVKIKRKDKILV